jgi:chromosome partitioning protein
MITIAFLNQKGGVGKTSLTCHLAGALALNGERVLAVDLDPQASLTQGRIGPKATKSRPPDLTTYAVAGGGGPDPLDLLITDGRSWDLLPASAALGEFNHAIARPRESACPACGHRFATDTSKLLALRYTLAELAEERGYRYALIDCPPNLQSLAAMALSAAQFLVIPMQPEDYGAQGLGPVLEFMESIRAGNPHLICAGIVINQRERLSLHRLFVERTRKEYGGLVFEAEIRRLGGFKEAIAARTTITSYDPKSVAADQIRALAAELVVRTGGDLP